MFISNTKLHVSAYSSHHQAISVIYNMHKPRFMHIMYNYYSKKVVKT